MDDESTCHQTPENSIDKANTKTNPTTSLLLEIESVHKINSKKKKQKIKKKKTLKSANCHDDPTQENLQRSTLPETDLLSS